MLLVLKAWRGLKAQQVAKGLQVRRVLQVVKVLQVHKVRQVVKALKARLVQLLRSVLLQGFTIEGARNFLKKEGKQVTDDTSAEKTREMLHGIRLELEDILKLFP